MRAERVILLERRAHGHQFTAPIVKERYFQPCSSPSFGRFAGHDPILRRDRLINYALWYEMFVNGSPV